MSPVEYFFWKPKHLNHFFLYMGRWFFKFLHCLVPSSREKNLMKLLLAFLKTLTTSKNFSESRITFLFGLPLRSLVDFFQCTFIAGFRNNFQDHRRVLKQLLETHTSIRKPEQALWRGLLDGISQLHRKKRLATFPSPAGMSLPNLFWAGIIRLFPPRECLW